MLNDLHKSCKKMVYIFCERFLCFIFLMSYCYLYVLLSEFCVMCCTRYVLHLLRKEYGIYLIVSKSDKEVIKLLQIYGLVCFLTDAFDREYKMAFSRLSPGEMKRLQRDDKPRPTAVQCCRRVFLELEL